MRWWSSRTRPVIAAAAAGAIWVVALGRVDAAVLPAKVIDAALASATALHRQKIPTTVPVPFYALGANGPAGFIDRDALDYGFLATGADVLMVPLDSGGSGGVFTTLLFTSVRTRRPVFVGPLNSAAGHLDVHLGRGRIVVTTPIYGANDPNCCPSAHRIAHYTLRNGKLLKLDEMRSP